MMYVICILYCVLVITAASHSDEQPYCSLRYRRLCQGKGRHVACQFPVSGPGTSCRNYTKIKFTSELRHFITHYINRRRQRIASGAERVRGGAQLPRPEVMMLVTWDRELCYLAQRLADQCHFVHDDCRATVRYPYAGQSVGEVRWRGSGEPSVQRSVHRVLDAWWGERRRVQPSQLITPFTLTNKGTVWGHFSQLAVWSLRSVGCAAVTHGRDYTRLLLVCDFSHTNMLGQKTISPGPIAPCPMHTVRKFRSPFPLLCAPVKKPTPPSSEDDSYDDFAEETKVYVDEEHETTVKTTQRTRTDVVKTKKYTDVQNIRVSLPRKNTVAEYLVIKNRMTTYRLMDKLDRELGLRNDNVKAVTMRYKQWESRPIYPEIREHQEKKAETKLLRGVKKLMTTEDDLNVPEYYRRSTLVEDLSTQGSSFRQRWKQTRIRLQRPGANALLNKPPEKQLPRIGIASLMLDQDDVDQLFQDTGFNVNWRKQSSEQ